MQKGKNVFEFEKNLFFKFFNRDLELKSFRFDKY